MNTATFVEFAERADYSLLEALTPDPEATADGEDHRSRQGRSGHYVPVTPTPIPEPQYLAHSRTLFRELGLSDDLAQDDQFRRMFSGDLQVATGPMRPWGWATGYALSIYGTEYTQQCPFGNGNGYGDGRAMSVFEGLFEGRRWEMQLKGGGPTPYCRGADGRAVLRSSIRTVADPEAHRGAAVPRPRAAAKGAKRIGPTLRCLLEPQRLSSAPRSGPPCWTHPRSCPPASPTLSWLWS